MAATSQYKLTTITNGSVVAEMEQNIPGQTSAVQPALQAQDGSFIGTVTIGSTSSMVGFDASSHIKWSVPGNYQPMIATADGGVIAQSLDTGASATFDANGKATGQMASLPTISWTNNAYQVGSIHQVPPAAVNIATTFWAFFQANASSNSTAAQPPYFPPLPTGPAGAIKNALQDLLTQLQTDTTCSNAAKLTVLSKFSDANGFALDTGNFIRYLTAAKPQFYDGTKSTWPYKNALCGPRSGFFNIVLNEGSCLAGAPGDAVTIKSKFSSTTAAATQTPSYPFLSFWNPGLIDLQQNGETLNNEANLFHEALHGQAGLDDSGLETTLGVGEPSSQVSDYIRQPVLSVCPIAYRTGGD